MRRSAALLIAVAALIGGAGHAGAQSAAVTLPAGSYTGQDSQNPLFNDVTFFVAANGTSIQDLAISSTSLPCSPGGGTIHDHLQLPSEKFGLTGSFSKTFSQKGVLTGGYTAKYSYTLTGTVSPGTSSASGTYSETITYTNGTKQTCTTGSQTWQATRDSQPTNQKPDKRPGSYTGQDSQNPLFDDVTFYLAANAKSIQDLAISSTSLPCSPGGGTIHDAISIGSIPVKSNGTFTASWTQSGVVAGGWPATFTYTFNGHVHGDNPSGTARVAGQYLETISYDDGTQRSCTTDNQYWSATFDSQPSNQNPDPRPGAYTGTDSQNPLFDDITFSVASDATAVQNLAVVDNHLTCSPGGGTIHDNSMANSSIPLALDGSFSATWSQNGTVGGFPAVFTYTFAGHVHGDASDGHARVGGQYLETISYNDGTQRSCTTDEQYWSANSN